MLTAFQEKKLTHYFNVLDFDNNGTLEKKDFTNIGQNLCVIWGLQEDGEVAQNCVAQFEQTWENFREFVGIASDQAATLNQWLAFSDANIVNGSDELYERHVAKVTREIISFFDSNKDGYLSLDEFVDFFMAYRIEIKYSAKSFTKLDTNGDDVISSEELLEAVRQFFRSDDEKAPGNWLFGFWEGRGRW